MENTENKFDLEAFKEYVNTYDTKRHGLDKNDTILADMIYGLGIAMNKDRYSFITGYDLFKERILKILEGK